MTKTTVKKAKQPPLEGLKIDPKMSIEDVMKRLVAIKKEKSQLSKREKELNADKDILDGLLISYLDEQEIQMMKNKSFSAIISETVVPNVVDWDALYDYVIENKATYLFYRQIVATAWRELKDSGELVPGTTETTIRKVNVKEL